MKRSSQIGILPSGGCVIVSGVNAFHCLGWTSIWEMSRDSFYLTYEEEGRVIDKYPLQIIQHLNGKKLSELNMDERDLRLANGEVSSITKIIRSGAEKPYPIMEIREISPGEEYLERDPNEPTEEEVVRAIRNLAKSG